MNQGAKLDFDKYYEQVSRLRTGPNDGLNTSSGRLAVQLAVSADWVNQQPTLDSDTNMATSSSLIRHVTGGKKLKLAKRLP